MSAGAVTITIDTDKPALWYRQGRDYHWHEPRQLGKWGPDGQFIPYTETVDASNDRAEASA